MPNLLEMQDIQWNYKIINENVRHVPFNQSAVIKDMENTYTIINSTYISNV